MLGENSVNQFFKSALKQWQIRWMAGFNSCRSWMLYTFKPSPLREMRQTIIYDKLLRTTSNRLITVIEYILSYCCYIFSITCWVWSIWLYIIQYWQFSLTFFDVIANCAFEQPITWTSFSTRTKNNTVLVEDWFL